MNVPICFIVFYLNLWAFIHVFSICPCNILGFIYTWLSSLYVLTYLVCNNFFFCPLFIVSGSNLASHMVGSLKKGSKQSMSLPSTAYNTLPAHVHHMRSTTSSPRVIAGQQQNKKHHHKRSPSSDSGTGSNTPVSSYHSGKVHHTVFLHGKYKRARY